MIPVGIGENAELLYLFMRGKIQRKLAQVEIAAADTNPALLTAGETTIAKGYGASAASAEAC